MSSNATAATARKLTATCKAATPGWFTTASQGPYSFRIVLHGETGQVGDLQAAGLAAHAIQAIDGGGRFTATWGRNRHGLLIINVTDETAREAAVAEMAQARQDALAKALADLPAVQPVPETGGEIRQEEHGARYYTAAEVAAQDAAAHAANPAAYWAAAEAAARHAAAVEATNAEVDAIAERHGLEVPTLEEAREVVRTETVEQWGPDAVVVTREYDAPQARVTATPATRGFRAGATGTVVAVDPEDGEVLVEWDDSQSGPSWTDPATLAAPAAAQHERWLAQVRIREARRAEARAANAATEVRPLSEQAQETLAALAARPGVCGPHCHWRHCACVECHGTVPAEVSNADLWR